MRLVRKLDAVRRMCPVAALAAVLVAGTAIAESDRKHREHDAHEHGHGTLDIVVEGEELVIELRMPAVNVVGFEHAPRDDAEREAVRQALVPFADGASVFLLPEGAECEPEAAEVEIFSMESEDDHAAKDGEKDDGHGHKTDKHAKAEDDEHEADSTEEAHSELHATYHFHCHAPGQLDRIDARVFEHLRDAEEIDVRVVTTTAQLAMELHADSTVVALVP